MSLRAFKLAQVVLEEIANIFEEDAELVMTAMIGGRNLKTSKIEVCTYVYDLYAKVYAKTNISA